MSLPHKMSNFRRSPLQKRPDILGGLQLVATQLKKRQSGRDSFIRVAGRMHIWHAAFIYMSTAQSLTWDEYCFRISPTGNPLKGCETAVYSALSYLFAVLLMALWSHTPSQSIPHSLVFSSSSSLWSLRLALQRAAALSSWPLASSLAMNKSFMSQWHQPTCINFFRFMQVLFFKTLKEFWQQFKGPGRMAPAPRACTSDSACRIWRYWCLSVPTHLFKFGTFLDRLPPLSDNR